MPIVQGPTGIENVAHLIQVDPTTTGFPAPIGATAYSFLTNAFYVKVGDSHTEWEQISLGDDASVVAVADWPIATVRTFLLDPVNGNDANLGYSDVVGPYNPATQAKRTVAGLREVFPTVFAGRTFGLILATGTYATSLDQLFSGMGGHGVNSYVRGTVTNSTASSVAFDDSLGDCTLAGFTTATGMFAAGYNPTGSITTVSVPCLKVGGAAPGFGAEPALPLGARMRFDAATATVALRNVSREVIKISGSTTLIPLTAWPATPSASDTFYLEEPGVVLPTISIGHNTPQPLGANHLQLVGLKATGAVTVQDGRFAFTGVFCGSHNEANTADWKCNSTYTHPVRGALALGCTLRCEGALLWQGPKFIRPSGMVIVGQVTMQKLLVGPANLANGPYVVGAGMFCPTVTSLGDETVVGSTSATTTTPFRIIGSGTLNCGLNIDAAAFGFNNLEITNVGAKPAIKIIASSFVTFVNAGSPVSGSTGNLDVGLDLTNAFGAVVVIGIITPTVTGLLGDIRLAGGQIITWAQAVATGIVDSKGNRICATTGPISGQAFSGSILGGAGATLSYLTGSPIPQAANQTTALRHPTSQMVAMRLRVTSISNTSANAVTCTLYKNGVATTMTVSIPAATAANTKFVDASHPILFSDGDDFDLRLDDAADVGAVVNVSARLEWAA